MPRETVPETGWFGGFFYPFLKTSLWKREKIIHLFTLFSQTRAVQVLLVLPCPASWYSQHAHPWEIAWNLPSDRSNFIFFLMAYLPAGGGQMRIPFSPIPDFFCGFPGDESHPVGHEVIAAGKSLRWHRGHGVKIHSKVFPA